MHEFSQWVKQILDTDWGILIGAAFLIFEIFSFIKFLTKIIKRFQRSIAGIFLIVGILAMGVAIPMIILYNTSWTGIGHILLNVLAIAALISFIGFVIVVLVMSPFLTTSKQKQGNAVQSEEAKFGLRTKRTFFNGELSIYMISVDFSGRPLDFQISANIWSLSYPKEVISKKGVGYSIMYQGKSKFTVRIKNAGINQATLEVTKH